MAAKEEQNQHVDHVAFKIHDFWPHDPNTWFRKLESKFRICNISQSSNGNEIKNKAEQSFDLDFVFDIEAKRTCLFQNL
jgi:hypothetical protein